MFQSFCFVILVGHKSQYFTIADRCWSIQIGDNMVSNANKSRPSMVSCINKFSEVWIDWILWKLVFGIFLIHKMYRKLHKSVNYTYFINLWSFYTNSIRKYYIYILHRSAIHTETHDMLLLLCSFLVD